MEIECDEKCDSGGGDDVTVDGSLVHGDNGPQLVLYRAPNEPTSLLSGNVAVTSSVSGHNDTVVITDPNSSTSTSNTTDHVELIHMEDLVSLPLTVTPGTRKVWKIIQNRMSPNDSLLVVDQVPTTPDGSQLSASSSLVLQGKPPPIDAPNWAKLINDCEDVGCYYRGWVVTDQDLDIVLTLHKQQTQSYWGTRQSPESSRPSARMMWRSQYVPFDGIPFINIGSRAVVMECQFGPRRKSCNRVKMGLHPSEFLQACPARIYVKKVRKFPEFAVDINMDKKSQKLAMDQAFTALRSHGFSSSAAQDRFYVQLPTEKAHEYHDISADTETDPHVIRTFDVRESQQCQGGNRVAEPVANKIRDLVASGIHHVTAIRKVLRKYVSQELFHGENVPVRHDLRYFPTVNDIQNHIHTALIDIENGTLPVKETNNVETLAIEHDHDWAAGWASNLDPRPETVTVTLTQATEGHTISRVETHMSDGSVQVSSSLTAETAALLARLHPNMFPSIQALVASDQPVDGAKITNLVQNIITKSKADAQTNPDLGPTSPSVHPLPATASEQANLVSHPTTVSVVAQQTIPSLPTEGVQLDLGLHDTTPHDVTQVGLQDGD